MTKTPLLLLHGALGSQSQFDGLQLKLQNEYDLHSFNFEGHGPLASDKLFTIVLFTEQLNHFIHDNNLKNLAVFGNSMGGYIALNHAKQYNNNIKTIITLGTKFIWSTKIAEDEVRKLNPTKIEAKIPHYAAYLEKLHRPQSWQDVMLKTAPLLTYLGTNSLKEDDLNTIETEAHIGIGSLDKMVTQEESSWAANSLPNGTVHFLEGVGHAIDKVDLDKVSQFIRRCMNS